MGHVFENSLALFSLIVFLNQLMLNTKPNIKIIIKKIKSAKIRQSLLHSWEETDFSDTCFPHLNNFFFPCSHISLLICNMFQIAPLTILLFKCICRAGH